MENITGVIVVTHGDLASAILETCEMLIGKHSHTSAVCYLPEHSRCFTSQFICSYF
ncbi:hypothetical protein [Enterobacter cloacae complex sp. 339J8]|uniref:PTS sugar transporter subunit IIA domain-containing protein n=1 Tax=Enterobacter cloacae complex sp. 339J8 TaxID=3395869 RepID=UPI003CF3B151